MALIDFRGPGPLYLLLAAAFTGVVVKTTTGAGTEGGSAKGEESSPTQKSSRKPGVKPNLISSDPSTPMDVPAPADPSDVEAFVKNEFLCPPQEPCPSPRLESFDVVITSLPDPATSGFVEEFDNGLDAIQQAAQTQDYTVDRHWLPWERGGAAMTDRTDATRAGWILFRKDVRDAQYRGLLVLVVGERLGSGIQQAMLADAIKIRRKLIGDNRQALFLGPYFSGTAASLRDGLERSCGSSTGRRLAPMCHCESTTIVSGTATRPLNADILGDTRDLSVTFQATVNPDALLSAAMHEFLHRSLDIDDEHIAELTETSTAFGVGHARDKEEVGPGQPQSLQVSMPLHVPDLRSPSANSKSLPSGFRDNAVSVDDTQLLTREALAEATQMLTSTVEALRRHDITDVGILATSSDDKISLVTALRGGAPDIRPHIYEANLALADPQQHAAMDGTLVASSYPLAPVTQIWASQPGVRLFTSDAAEGAYNAMLALLWKAQAIDARALQGALRDYEFPFGPDRSAGPPVWISVIVGGQVWALAAYRPELDLTPGYVFGSEPSCCSERFGSEVTSLTTRGPVTQRATQILDRSGFATITLLGLFAFVLGNLLSLIRSFVSLRRCPFLLHYDPEPTEGASRSGGPSVGWFDECFFFDRIRDPDFRPAILLGIWVLAICGLATACFYEFPQLLDPTLSFDMHDLLGTALLFASGLLLLSPLASRPSPPRGDSDTTCWRRFTRPGHWSHRPLHASLIVGFGAFAAVAVWRFTRLGVKSDGRAFFFFARLMHPGLGLTPALPVAIMAAILYLSCLFRLRVVRRALRLRSEGEHWVGDPLFDSARGIQDFAASSLRSLSHILWMGSTVGLALFLWQRIRPRSLEGWSFDLLVALGFGLTFAVAGASIWRANRLWRMLAQFLRGLADHPWAPAFGKMPAHISGAFQTPMPGRLNTKEVATAREITSRLAAANPLEGSPAAMTHRSGASTDAPDVLIPEFLEALAPRWRAAGVCPPALTEKGDSRTSEPAVQLREHYLALCMTESISYMCDATRTTLFVGSTAAVAAVLATAAYPFQPAGTLAWAAKVSIAVVVLVSVRVIAGIERDDILSRIGKTAPGKLTPSWSLVVRLIGYVLVPLGSLAAARLPDHGLLTTILHSFSVSLEH